MLKESPGSPDRVKLSPTKVFLAGAAVTLLLVGLIVLYVPAQPPLGELKDVQTFAEFDRNQYSSPAPDASGTSTADQASSGQGATPEGLFLTYCAQCHGKQGDSDAPLARMMTVKPPNLLTGPYKITRDAPAIAQVIRRGIGTMPGFAEEISEAQALDLAAYVLALPKLDTASEPVTP